MPSYGRGGAGNIKAVTQQKERIAADVEANASVEDSGIGGDLTRISQGATGQYVKSGRGGAGNFYDPAEVPTEVETSTQLAVGKPAEQHTARTAGRGGAGNYESAANSGKQSAAAEEAKETLFRERIAADVEKVINQELAIPQNAKLAQSRSLK